MLGHRHFYNRTIRKIVVAFGSLFNDLEIVRYSKDGLKEYERIRVPISYGPKEKYVTRLASDPTLTKSINVSLPRISFNMEGLTYDPSRKQSILTRNYAAPASGSGVNTQYAPMPYNFDFSLSIYVRNTEDGTQLIEQILPFFQPDFTVTVDLMPGMDQKYDMPIILNSASPDIDYEGDMITTRMIIWTLTFTVKSFIFPPMITNNQSGLIKSANTNVFINTNMQSAQKVFVDYANGKGVFTTGETIRVQNKPVYGTVTYFSNNASGILIVENLNDLLDDHDVIKGDYSNAKYTIDSIDMSPLKAFSVVTQPDPIDAQIDDAYGFSETIVEYPLTLVSEENVKDLTTEDGNFIVTEDDIVLKTEI